MAPGMAAYLRPRCEHHPQEQRNKRACVCLIAPREAPLSPLRESLRAKAAVVGRADRSERRQQPFGVEAKPGRGC
eukprot:479808-Rhodomonas_salina.1